MARTYRRKSGDIPNWILRPYEYIRSTEYHWGYYLRKDISPKSKEGKKILANYHSDAFGKPSWSWPGWGIANFVQKPYRRHCASEIKKALRDPDYEVVLRSKPRKGYWD